MTISHALLANTTSEETHGIIWQTVANAAARALINVPALAVSQAKVVRQADSGQLWIPLTTGVGATWLALTTLTAFDITSFGLTGSTLVLAGASVVNPAFAASYNAAATAVTLTDTEGHSDVIALPGTAFVSPHTFTKTAYGAVVSFTDSANGPPGTGSDTAVASITWGQNVFYGAAVDPGVYNSAFVTSLTATLKLAPAGTYAYNAGATQSCFFCTRTAFGLTTANFTVNGFPFACSKVAAAVAVTNANGVVENYDVFRSDNIGLGAFSLVEA